MLSFTQQWLSIEREVFRNSLGRLGRGSNCNILPRCFRRATLPLHQSRAGPRRSLSADRKFPDASRLTVNRAKIPIRELGENLIMDSSGTPIKTTQINKSQNMN